MKTEEVATELTANNPQIPDNSPNISRYIFSYSRYPKLGDSLTWLIRIIIGITFIFSGFVKAIDPWGTFYKFEEYFGVWGWDIPSNLILAGVFFLCVYEFCIGVFLLLGCYRRSATWAALLMMSFMLPLTLWIAIKDPVADCGCFGEALIISNWATFWKNIGLVVGIIWLIKYNLKCSCIIRPYIQWIAFICSAVFIVVIGLVGYFYQPLIDFRPFPIGTKIKSDSQVSPASISEPDAQDVAEFEMENSEDEEMLFVYSKDGKEYTFSISDELPDENDGWIFVRRETLPSSTTTLSESNGKSTSPFGKTDNETSMQLWSEDGEEELTDRVIIDKGYQILLTMPDLKDVSLAETWRINSLSQWASDNNIDIVGVVAGSREEIENWKDISLASYPIFTAEDTQIKMLVRGNPGIVIIKDGIILWKSSLRALFTDDFQASETYKDTESFIIDNDQLLHRIIYIYIICMSVLVALSFLPYIAHLFPKNMKAKIDKRNEKINDAERRMEVNNEKRRSHFKKDSATASSKEK